MYLQVHLFATYKYGENALFTFTYMTTKQLRGKYPEKLWYFSIFHDYLTALKAG